MATPETVKVQLTLSLSKTTQERLAERAAASGTDLAAYASAILEQSANGPLTLEEISGPIYLRFLESGMSDDELSELLETEKHLARAERRSRRAS